MTCSAGEKVLKFIKALNSCSGNDALCWTVFEVKCIGGDLKNRLLLWIQFLFNFETEKFASFEFSIESNDSLLFINRYLTGGKIFSFSFSFIIFSTLLVVIWESIDSILLELLTFIVGNLLMISLLFAITSLFYPSFSP